MRLLTLRKRYDNHTLVSTTERTLSLIPTLSVKKGVTKKEALSKGDESQQTVRSSIFKMDDKAIGFCFICEPLTGFDNNTQERANSLLNHHYPDDTVMQTLLIRSPDISQQIYEMQVLRRDQDDPLLRSVVDQRADFLKNATCTGIDSRGTKAVDLKLIISFKIPIKSELPSVDEMTEAETTANEVLASLETLGVQPEIVCGDTYIRLMEVLMNWGPDAAWRHHLPSHNEDLTIGEQIVDYDKPIEVSSEFLKLGDTYAKTLSAKRLPEGMYFGDAIVYAGDMHGQNTGFRGNYMIACNVVFPKHEETKQALERNRQFVVNQAYGPIQKFVPVLGEKKYNYDLLNKSLEDGNRPIRVSYTVTVFADSKEAVDKAAMAVRSTWRQSRFELIPDVFMQLPMFINSMPLCADLEGIKELFRYKTMAAEHAGPILPLFGEWKGTGTPLVNLFSRNGQLMSMSFHDSGSNYNYVIAAQSGSGKSFLQNEIVSSVLSEGGIVWGIDVGRSYEKVCEAYDGDFIHFGEESNICLNPFELIRNWEEEEDAVIGLLATMAAPTEPLDDFKHSGLKRVTQEVWNDLGVEMLVDDVEKKLLEQNDERLQDVGHQLYAFTSRGSYGKYFNGKNTIAFENRFTMLELEELKGRKHLQKVVLLQLIYQIQQEMYLSNAEKRKIKKLVFIDEAWDLLSEGDVAKFIEHGYRRFRKYGGFVGIITQSINDLYNSPTGHAIAENSATTILMGQKRETITKIKEEKRLDIAPGQFQLLKTIHTVPNAYSEMFIISERGSGIGRLVVNDFQKLLYSTHPNDVSQIAERQNQGMSVEEAITDILNQRRQEAIARGAA